MIYSKKVRRKKDSPWSCPMSYISSIPCINCRWTYVFTLQLTLKRPSIYIRINLIHIRIISFCPFAPAKSKVITDMPVHVNSRQKTHYECFYHHQTTRSYVSSLPWVWPRRAISGMTDKWIRRMSCAWLARVRRCSRFILRLIYLSRRKQGSRRGGAKMKEQLARSRRKRQRTEENRKVSFQRRDQTQLHTHTDTDRQIYAHT